MKLFSYEARVVRKEYGWIWATDRDEAETLVTRGEGEERRHSKPDIVEDVELKLVDEDE